MRVMSFRTYQPNGETLSLFTDFLTKGDAWVIMTNQLDWHVISRFIAEPHNGFAHGFTTDWIRTTAELVKSNETKIELINFADRLDNEPNVRSPIGNKHFFVSDYQVHRRTIIGLLRLKCNLGCHYQQNVS